MPSAAARRLYEDQLPSFMSVFDEINPDSMDAHGGGSVTVVDHKLIAFPGSSFAGKLASQPSSFGSAATSTVSATSAASDAACDPSHRHHDSTSTQASESTDSSPTTTVSCTDSSLSDPSPSSSPDSAVHLVPLAPFSSLSFGRLPVAMDAALSKKPFCPDSNENGSSMVQRPMTSPSLKRARNMKGLSIQPPFASPTLASSTRLSEPSSPSSPSFIKPQIQTMKRKPSQLSLKTSTHDLHKTAVLQVPPSPAIASVPPILQRRALKHSTSSPHMLSSLKSSTFGPLGGMGFPTVLERNESGLSEFLRPSRHTEPPAGFDATILEEESPIRTQIANRAAFEFEPFHEQENNEDQKTPGYPNGPIAIYGDNVFLYLEPTAEEAARFDLVINVAREVTNPFRSTPDSTNKDSTAPSTTEVSLPPPRRTSAPKLETIIEPETEQAVRSPVVEAAPVSSDHNAQQQQLPSTVELEPVVVETATQLVEPTTCEPTPTAVEEPAPTAEPASNATPDPPAPTLCLPHRPLVPLLSVTPAASTVSLPNADDNTPTTPKAHPLLKEPEYMHIPWDHHTDIGSDLMTLCETIEKKTKEGKKVLIHCQQGASRSASLIIAYGMYQNPDLSVNDAYHAAQAKSQWISPNMRLMYCLQDFQKEVAKRRRPTIFGLRPPSGRSPTKHRATLSADGIDSPTKREPLSAPLPAEEGKGGSLGSHSTELSPLRPRGNSTPTSREAVSPGPSSAPSSLSWNVKEDENDPYKLGRFHFDEPSTTTTTTTTTTSITTATPLSKPAPSPVKATHRPVGLRLPGSSSSVDGVPKPPPSPGFAAHRFGELSGSSSSSRPHPNPISLAGFSLQSPGLRPPHSAGNDGLDCILSRSMNSAAAAGSPPPPPQLPQPPRVWEQPLSTQTVSMRPAFPIDEPLLSPRAEAMTNNPLHSSFGDGGAGVGVRGAVAGMRFVEAPPTPSEGVFSPRETMFPRDPFSAFGRPTQGTDPRSPPTKGETPIVRSIDDLL